MQKHPVAIKGIKDGLLVSFSPTEEWNGMTSDLAARIDEQSSFYNGARVTVDFGARPVRKHELSSLKVLLERRGLTLWSVISESGTTIDAASALDLRTGLNNNVRERAPAGVEADESPIDPEETGMPGVMLRRTLRSGRTLHSSGHVVIFGDVNPGAEIVANGDVIIWGTLRGNVHAGAEGDESAVVCALGMMPNQLRIAGYIVTSPEEQRRELSPEIASIRDGQIVVHPWR